MYYICAYILGGKGGRCVRLTTLPPSRAVVTKSRNLNFLEPSGPVQACNGIIYVHTYINAYILHTFHIHIFYTYIHTYMHYMHTYISYIHTHIHTNTRAYIHYIHTYIHTFPTYIHTLRSRYVWKQQSFE